VVLESWGRRGRSKSGDLVVVLGRGSGWGGSRVHLGPIWVLVWGGKMTGDRVRRRSVAEAVSPTRLRLGRGNQQPGELNWCRRKDAGSSRGDSTSREGELAMRLPMAGVAA
jgi:hypothetical protein